MTDSVSMPDYIASTAGSFPSKESVTSWSEQIRATDVDLKAASDYFACIEKIFGENEAEAKSFISINQMFHSLLVCIRDLHLRQGRGGAAGTAGMADGETESTDGAARLALLSLTLSVFAFLNTYMTTVADVKILSTAPLPELLSLVTPDAFLAASFERGCLSANYASSDIYTISDCMGKLGQMEQCAQKLVGTWFQHVSAVLLGRIQQEWAAAEDGGWKDFLGDNKRFVHLLYEKMCGTTYTMLLATRDARKAIIGTLYPQLSISIMQRIAGYATATFTVVDDGNIKEVEACNRLLASSLAVLVGLCYYPTNALPLCSRGLLPALRSILELFCRYGEYSSISLEVAALACTLVSTLSSLSSKVANQVAASGLYVSLLRVMMYCKDDQERDVYRAALGGILETLYARQSFLRSSVASDLRGMLDATPFYGSDGEDGGKDKDRDGDAGNGVAQYATLDALVQALVESVRKYDADSETVAVYALLVKTICDAGRAHDYLRAMFMKAGQLADFVRLLGSPDMQVTAKACILDATASILRTRYLDKDYLLHTVAPLQEAVLAVRADCTAAEADAALSQDAKYEYAECKERTRLCLERLGHQEGRDKGKQGMVVMLLAGVGLGIGLVVRLLFPTLFKRGFFDE